MYSKIYVASELLEENTRCFVCPHCAHPFVASDWREERRTFKPYDALGICRACHKQTPLRLPKIRKKLIYLDQSALGSLHACMEPHYYSQSENTARWSSILEKIRQVQSEQKAMVIVSDVHVRETAAVPREDKRLALWKFANDLADGCVSGSGGDVFVDECRAAVTSQQFGSDTRHQTLLNVDPQKWQIWSPVQLTNSWRLRHASDAPARRVEINDMFERVYDKQALDSAHCVDATDCQKVVIDRCVAEVGAAIGYLKECSRFQKSLLCLGGSACANSAALPKCPERPAANGYIALLYAAFDRDHREDAVDALDKKLQQQHLQLFPSLYLSAIFEGELLWMWLSGLRKNPKKFNENYGASRWNDIDHLASYVSIVDVLTVDSDTYNLCQREPIRNELAKYPCKLIHSGNLDQLVTWLDELINFWESDEHRLSSHLLTRG